MKHITAISYCHRTRFPCSPCVLSHFRLIVTVQVTSLRLTEDTYMMSLYSHLPPRAAHLRIHSSLLKLWRAVVHALGRTVFTHWLRLKRRKLIWGNNMLTGVWTNVEVRAHNLQNLTLFNTILYDDHWHRIFLFHHIYYDSCLLVTLQIKFDIQNIWSIYKVMDCHTFKNPILCKN